MDTRSRQVIAAGTAMVATIGLAALTSNPAGASTRHVTVTGTFASPASAANAFTYDPMQVPIGAMAVVRAVATPSGKTVVALHVRGLVPGEEYGAHAHYRPCGASGTDAGAHYQSVPDPAAAGSETTASTDPAYANGDNELWLDFTTDDEGNGSAQSVVDWQFRDAPTGRSIIIHRDHTSHGDPGSPPPGNAGPRLGCVTVAF